MERGDFCGDDVGGVEGGGGWVVETEFLGEVVGEEETKRKKGKRNDDYY